MGLTISAMRVPFIIQVALPFMMLFATMATLMTLNRKYELVVARSVGISAWQFLLPTWAAAFVIGVLAVLLLQPAAAAIARALQLCGMQTVPTTHAPALVLAGQAPRRRVWPLSAPHD